MKCPRQRTSWLRVDNPQTIIKQVSKSHSNLKNGQGIIDTFLVKLAKIKKRRLCFLPVFLPNWPQINSISKSKCSIYLPNQGNLSDHLWLSSQILQANMPLRERQCLLLREALWSKLGNHIVYCPNQDICESERGIFIINPG